jgi:hypothetical protein
LGTENAYTIRKMGAKSRFIVTFRAGFFGPLFPDRLIAYRHHNFMGTVLPGLLEAVSVNAKQTLWFQHNISLA